MADINVTKGGPTIWPWVLGLLVLALMIWALAEVFGDDAEINIPDPIADTVTVSGIDQGSSAFHAPSALPSVIPAANDTAGAPVGDTVR